MASAGSYGLVYLCSIAVFLFVINNYAYCYELKKVEIKPMINGKPAKIFTADEMKKYDGSDPSKPLYMGVKGVVFDVSEGKDFYGKNAPYNVLIGRDSSKAVAKMSLESEDLTHDISDLSDDILKSLDDVFAGTYAKKYPVAGYMDFLKEQFPEEFKNTRDDL